MPTSVQSVMTVSILWLICLAVSSFRWHSSRVEAFVVQSRFNSRSIGVALSRLQGIVDGWNGEVVSNDPEGKIRGCSLQQEDGSLTDWIVRIDGEEADLGRFSQAIYKKISADAKQQRFQGFRPGTIPPHLQATYVAFTMDECARETVLEAMQQNNIRPFESTRTDLTIEQISLQRVPKRSSSKKKKRSTSSKKGRRRQKSRDDATDENEEAVAAEAAEETEEEESSWRTFASIREAVDSGWRPGTSFSFVARKVRGQKLKDESETEGAMPLGLNY